jgi:fatty-acyl-CoA synthase
MDLPLTPLALVERGALAFPDRTAVVSDRFAWTYAQFAARLGRVAGAMASLGVGEGERVALLAPNTAQALECYTGVPLGGAVLVPLNTRLSADEYAYILAHSESRVLIVDASLLHAVEPALQALGKPVRVVVQGSAEPPPGCLSYDDLLADALPIALGSEAIDERATMTLNYTSGTTARPKGVMISHRSACLNAVNMVLAMRLVREDAHLHVAPMFHANGWGFVWATLAVGAANVPLPRVSGEAILDRVERFGVTHLCAAPTVLRMILREAARRPTPVRSTVRLATAGGPPSAATLRQIEELLGWHVTHLYGLTETTAFATYCEEPLALASMPLEAKARFKARQGIPLLLSGKVRVERPDGGEVLADATEMGEVAVRGNVVMQGYHRDSEATAQALRGGWFRTGDLAVRHPDGYIELRDRLKDVIKSGGEQIPSIEVEATLNGHPAVAEVAVVAAPDPDWGETPAAFVVLHAGARTSAEELRAFCREHLSHFKVPTVWVFVDDLPRTASGKVRKAVLRQALVQDGEGIGRV